METGCDVMGRLNYRWCGKVLLILGGLLLVALPVQAKEKDKEGYSNEDRELVYYVMIYKKLCDEMSPDFQSENYNTYLKWKNKYSSLVEWIKQDDDYQIAISRIYDNPNKIPQGKELDEICTNIARQYRKGN